MPGQCWELKTVEIIFDIPKYRERAGGDQNTTWHIEDWMPTPGDSAEKGMSRAMTLASQGWELVSAVPINEALIYTWGGVGVAGAGGAGATKKLVLFFKRLVSA